MFKSLENVLSLAICPFISSKDTFFSTTRGNSHIKSNNLTTHTLGQTLTKVIDSVMAHNTKIYLLNSFVDIMNLNLISSCSIYQALNIN